jgi:hypothetical protein
MVSRSERPHSSKCDRRRDDQDGTGAVMSARLNRRRAWGARSGFFAIPVGAAGLFLAAPLLTGATGPGLTAVHACCI